MDDAQSLRLLPMWERFSGALRAWLADQTGGDAHAAEDLLQECFLRVHDGLPELRDVQRFGPWLQRIAKNLVIDWRRGLASSPIEALQQAAGLEELLPELPQAEQGLDRLVASWLAPAIEQLDARDRMLLQLTDLEGLSQVAAAARLGLSLSALKSRVLRARRRLRESILACCQLEFDSRGGIVDYRRRSSICGPCDEDRPESGCAKPKH